MIWRGDWAVWSCGARNAGGDDWRDEARLDGTGRAKGQKEARGATDLMKSFDYVMGRVFMFSWLLRIGLLTASNHCNDWRKTV